MVIKYISTDGSRLLRVKNNCVDDESLLFEHDVIVLKTAFKTVICVEISTFGIEFEPRVSILNEFCDFRSNTSYYNNVRESNR